MIHYKNCSRSAIEVRPTALLRYHAHTRWTLTTDLALWPWLLITGELWSSHTQNSSSKISRFKR